MLSGYKSNGSANTEQCASRINYVHFATDTTGRRQRFQGLTQPQLIQDVKKTSSRRTRDSEAGDKLAYELSDSVAKAKSESEDP